MEKEDENESKTKSETGMSPKQPQEGGGDRVGGSDGDCGAGDLKAIKDAYEKRLADANAESKKAVDALNAKLKERDEFVAELLRGEGPKEPKEDAFLAVLERRNRQRKY